MINFRSTGSHIEFIPKICSEMAVETELAWLEFGKAEECN